jgi:hypothetical protein
MNIIKAIVIKTNTKETGSDYGLFAVSGEFSVFRFAEKQLSGVSDFDHNYSFVTKNGIPDIFKKCDLSESGNAVQSSDIVIRLKNTTQFDKYLSSNAISLLKSTIEFYTFVGTDADSDSVGMFLDGIRTVDSYEYNETEIVLKVKMSLSRQRNRRLSVTLDEANYPYVPESNKNKMIPLIFGSSDPETNRYFKILRSSAKEIKITNQKIRELTTNDESDITPDYLFKYPVTIEKTPLDEIYFAIGVYNSDIVAEFTGLTLLGFYILIKDGVSGIEGVYRKIVTSTSYYTAEYELSVDAYVDNYFPLQPKGNASANATDQTWLELYDLSNEYEYSAYDLDGFYDSLTEVASENPIIYTKQDDILIPILETGVDIVLSGNKITFNPMIFTGNIDTIKSFKCIPFEAVEMYEGENLDLMGLTGFNTVKTQSSGIEGDPIGGFYKNPTTELRANAPTSTYSNPTYCLDKNSTTYTRLYASPIVSSGNVTVYGVLELFLPEIPTGLKFKKCYLGINCDLLMGYTSGDAPVLEKIIVSKKGYYGDPTKIEKEINSGGISTVGSVKNLPDFYYSDTVSNKNQQFLVTDTAVDLTGYTMFDLGISDVNEYRNVYKMFVAAGMRLTGTSSAYIDLKYNELALIFENDQDISTEAYV